MYLLLSHVVAFLALTVNSFYDVFSEKGDVPDLPAVVAIVAGVLLHGGYAWSLGSFEPFLWMIGVGAVFSLYGWIAFWRGLWGGADAMAMSVLGFAAPYSISGVSLIYPMDIFVNMMIAGLLYSVSFAVYRAFRSESFIDNFRSRVYGDRYRIPLEIGAGAAFSLYAGTVGLDPVLYFLALVFIIFLYRFLKVLEDAEMSTTVPVEDLEGGEVVAEQGGTIEGITEEEIEDLDVDEVEVKEGIRFIPVFPVALLMTDVFGGGVSLLIGLF